MLLTYKENVHSTQMYIPLKPLFSRHKGIGVQFTDEPTGNLDSKSGGEVMKMLCDLRAKMKKTLIVITHDPHIAEMAERRFTIIDGVLSEVTVR